MTIPSSRLQTRSHRGCGFGRQTEEPLRWPGQARGARTRSGPVGSRVQLEQVTSLPRPTLPSRGLGNRAGPDSGTRGALERLPLLPQHLGCAPSSPPGSPRHPQEHPSGSELSRGSRLAVSTSRAQLGVHCPLQGERNCWLRD